ncbi:transcriptional regulator [Streptomyces sulfonofaciens]|uniref:Transcriptional regulator n=1 Tax=Streptomyces sulfonofaciens TaxID=68272 RepID=A0A919L0E7_9ACTN|nr:helix-turn-helix transcriptional regulator [Streptomyces sulfonofaciens]GHH80245.1 transcriptional regulator [Streptomyces sulfonofaciens]
MLRVHFTADDLVRIRLLSQPNPLWEILLSFFCLREQRKRIFLQAWARQLRTDAQRWKKIVPAARLMAGLAPQGPYFPDFLTPAQGCTGLDTGLDAIAGTPRRRLTHELNLLAECNRRKDRTTPSWLASFAAGDANALAHLTRTLRDYHETAIAQNQAEVASVIGTDVALRTRALLNGGVEGLLRSFEPLMVWTPPVLHVRYDYDRDLHLCGRGLFLVPSYYCHGSAVSTADRELTPVIIYPIATRQRWRQTAGSKPNDHLTRLLGATRASVLHAAGTSLTTTDLARVLSTSPASISRHTKVLRENNLLTTCRQGNSVLHVLTELGRELVRGEPTGFGRPSSGTAEADGGPAGRVGMYAQTRSCAGTRPGVRC